MNPFKPLSISSETAQSLLFTAITGRPHAKASITTIPNPSRVDGRTIIFDDFIYLTTSFSSRKPVNVILLVMPNCFESSIRL